MTATEERVRQLLHTVDQRPVQRRDLLALARARRRRQRLLLAACGLVLVLLSGLLTGWALLRPGEGRRAVIAATPSPETSARRTAVPVSPSPSPSPSGEGGSAALACTEPSKELLDWAGVSVASHPGPWLRTALVPAGKTSTGTWYVLAVERGYVHDDGSRAEGSSISVALTNQPDAPVEAKVIPLAEGEAGNPVAVSWQNVNWDAAQRARGEAAVDAALACIGQ